MDMSPTRSSNPNLLGEEEQGMWDPSDMHIKLEPEFYTAAFVSPLHLHQQRTPIERAWGEIFFTVGMLAVCIMQCLTVFGMSSYLSEKDNGYMDEFKLGTGLFTMGGSTLAAGHAKDLCGNFNHIGLHALTGVANVSMPDGTLYEGTSQMPMFHSYKMPSGDWNFHSISGDESYVDKQLRVVHDVNWGLSGLIESMRTCRVEYGVLLVIMVGWLWYHVLHEVRKIQSFIRVLLHFYRKGLVENSIDTTELDDDTGSIRIRNLNRHSLALGCVTTVMRIIVVSMMLVWGTSLLAASSNKLSLVLNSLAIGIVFELDSIIAYAVIDHNTMQRIESLEPVIVTNVIKGSSYFFDTLSSVAMLVGVFLCAMLVRYYQVQQHSHQLNNAAALCLFAGPTPQGRQDLIAPVPGFCESLLSLTCAPKVTGDGSSHGHCLITDQKVFSPDRSTMHYADEALFEGMYDKHGKRRSMAKWGPPSSALLNTHTWVDDKHLHLFRRVCTQLYHPEGALDKRVVDDDLGLKMYSAPFYCSRDHLFSAVFGNVENNFDNWANNFDLQADAVVKALDHCHEPIQLAHSEASTDDVDPLQNSHSVSFNPAPAPAAQPGFAPVAASSNLLRVGRHNTHHHSHHQVHEVQHRQGQSDTQGQAVHKHRVHHEVEHHNLRVPQL